MITLFITLLVIHYILNTNKSNNWHINTPIIFKICDINNDNKLYFKEFRKCAVDKNKKRLSNIFQNLDQNNDNYLTMRELNGII